MQSETTCGVQRGTQSKMWSSVGADGHSELQHSCPRGPRSFVPALREVFWTVAPTGRGAQLPASGPCTLVAGTQQSRWQLVDRVLGKRARSRPEFSTGFSCSVHFSMMYLHSSIVFEQHACIWPLNGPDNQSPDFECAAAGSKGSGARARDGRQSDRRHFVRGELGSHLHEVKQNGDSPQEMLYGVNRYCTY